MERAIIYYAKTGLEATDHFVPKLLEKYCQDNGYEIVAMLSEPASTEGVSFPMKYAFIGLNMEEDVNTRSSGLKKYDVYEKAITRQRRELEKVNRKFSELYGDYSEHLINESEYLTLKQQYLLKSEALKKEIDNLLVSQNLYSKNYRLMKTGKTLSINI